MTVKAVKKHNAQIKRRYYYYNSFRRRCAFLCVLCFALFNQIVQILVTKPRILRQGKGYLHIKRHFFCFDFSQLLFSIQCFFFYHLEVNTLIVRQISFTPAENALERLLMSHNGRLLYPYYPKLPLQNQNC